MQKHALPTWDLPLSGPVLLVCMQSLFWGLMKNSSFSMGLQSDGPNQAYADTKEEVRSLSMMTRYALCSCLELPKAKWTN